MAMAAMRDASWLNHPDCHKSKRYHVIADDGETPMCGQFMMKNQDSEIDAATVDARLRCKKNGCRQAFDKADRKAKENRDER